MGCSHKDYITKISSGSGNSSNNNNNSSSNNGDSTTVTEKDGVVNATVGLKVRQGAGTNTNVLATLKHGSAVKIVGTSGDWYKIKYNSDYGYVHKDYIIIKESSNESSHETKPEVSIKKGEVYNTGSNLRVRSAASTSSIVLGYLVDGTEVDIVGSEGNWYKINFKDKTGFVSKDYVRLITENQKPEEKPEIPVKPPVIPEEKPQEKPQENPQEKPSVPEEKPEN